MSGSNDEVVVPFREARERVQPTTAFRSTWLTASLDALRAKSLFERYLENLPAEHHEPILRSVAGTWLPVVHAEAHYRACDALGLAVPEQVSMGRDVLARLQKTIFSLGFHAARDAGMTPWSMLKLFPSEFDRGWRGGACGVFRVGPKDARIELIGFTCAAIPYTRVALRGLGMALCELVCTKAYAHDIAALCTPTTLAYRLAWA
jgi:hypothetical protein